MIKKIENLHWPEFVYFRAGLCECRPFGPGRIFDLYVIGGGSDFCECGIPNQESPVAPGCAHTPAARYMSAGSTCNTTSTLKCAVMADNKP